jgi:hypothetical protein
MILGERPPIPPLSEAAVVRLERRIRTALDRGDGGDDEALVPAGYRRRWWNLALVPLAVLLTLGGVRLLRHDDGLPRGARIATAGTGSHVTIQGAAVDVAPRSTVAIGGEPDGTTLLLLERGSVTCRVAPRSGQAPFVVQAGATRVTVIGTRFTVERRGEHAAVSVEHGLVEISDDGLTQMIHAGERYQPRDEVADEVVSPPLPPAPATKTAGAARATPVAARPAVPPSSGPRDRTALRGEARVALAPPPLPAASVEPVAPPPEPAPAPSAAPAPEPAAPTSPPSEGLLPARQRFEAARRLEARAPAAALRQYLELAQGTDSWAANALFAAARLALDQGRSSEARTLLDSYLERFPGGNNAEDARALLRRLR